MKKLKQRILDTLCAHSSSSYTSFFPLQFFHHEITLAERLPPSQITEALVVLVEERKLLRIVGELHNGASRINLYSISPAVFHLWDAKKG